MNLVTHESRRDCSSSRILLCGVVTDSRDGCLSCRKWFEDHEHLVCEERDCKPVVNDKERWSANNYKTVGWLKKGGRPGLKRRDSRRKCLWPVQKYMFLSEKKKKNKSVRTLLNGEICSNCLSIRVKNCVLFLKGMTGTYYENNTNHRNTLCKKYRVFK